MVWWWWARTILHVCEKECLLPLSKSLAKYALDFNYSLILYMTTTTTTATATPTTIAYTSRRFDVVHFNFTSVQFSLCCSLIQQQQQRVFFIPFVVYQFLKSSKLIGSEQKDKRENGQSNNNKKHGRKKNQQRSIKTKTSRQNYISCTREIVYGWCVCGAFCLFVFFFHYLHSILARSFCFVFLYIVGSLDVGWVCDCVVLIVHLLRYIRYKWLKRLKTTL